MISNDKKAGDPVQGQPPAHQSSRIPRAIAQTLIAGAVAAVVGWGAYIHYQRSAQAWRTSRETEQYVPAVRIAAVRAASPFVSIELPGETGPFDVAALNARATGYIAKRLADIGSVVHKDESMAVIASPELDAQLAQSRAQLTQNQAALAQAYESVRQAKANYDLSVITDRRWAKLSIDGWEPRQTGDNFHYARVARAADLANVEAGIAVARATVQAQQAVVARLEQLTSYDNVVAPFDGVVTERHVDTGDLVSADMSSGSGQRMFVVSRLNLLRVRIDIPQSVANGISDGIAAQVNVPEMPGRVFTGRIARSSVSLASDSRTLRAEVDVDNPDLILRAGQYVLVHFEMPRTQPSVTIPTEALIFNAQGTQVAVVKSDVVQLQPVHILRDRGTELDIDRGLEVGETVVLNPYAELASGQRVKPLGPASSAPGSTMQQQSG